MLGGVFLVSLRLGAVQLSLGQVWGALWSFADPTARLIVWDFRLARSLVALLVGAAQGAAGAVVQGVLRNPLGDPHILGVSGGATFVAVTVLTALPQVPMRLVPALALPGGVLAGALAYRLAWEGGVAPDRLALSGVAVGALFSAGTTIVVVNSPYKITQSMIWLSGSLWGRSWEHLLALWPWVVPSLLIIFIMASKINVLTLGDDVARGLGVRVDAVRLLLTGLASILAASAVAVAGPIGFVGLTVPHLARLLVGTDHRSALPVAALLGAVLVLAADTAGRTLVAPLEIPAGVVTALLGAPYFLYLLRKGQA